MKLKKENDQLRYEIKQLKIINKSLLNENPTAYVAYAKLLKATSERV